MKLYKYHLFVCSNIRSANHPKSSCTNRSCDNILEAFKMELELAGLNRTVLVSSVKCLGPCASGPCVVVYPEGIWYGKLDDDGVEKIVEHHIKDGKPIEELRIKSYKLVDT